MNLRWEINDLPEGVGSEALRSYFDSVICDDSLENVDERLELLGDLAEKQWHAYEKIDAELASRLHQWLVIHWDGHSLEKTETVTSIVAQLGLTETFEFLKLQQSSTHISESVRAEINALVQEIGDMIDDPYSGMSK